MGSRVGLGDVSISIYENTTSDYPETLGGGSKLYAYILFLSDIYFNTKWSIHLSNIRMNYLHSKHHICEDRCKSVLLCKK